MHTSQILLFLHSNSDLRQRPSVNQLTVSSVISPSSSDYWIRVSANLLLSRPSSMSDVGESEPTPLKPDGPVLSEESKSPMQFTTSAAAKIASQPLPNYDPSVWGVLTAISNKARKRPQVLLTPKPCIPPFLTLQFLVFSPLIAQLYVLYLLTAVWILFLL